MAFSKYSRPSPQAQQRELTKSYAVGANAAPSATTQEKNVRTGKEGAGGDQERGSRTIYSTVRLRVNVYDTNIINS